MSVNLYRYKINREANCIKPSNIVINIWMNSWLEREGKNVCFGNYYTNLVLRFSLKWIILKLTNQTLFIGLSIPTQLL